MSLSAEILSQLAELALAPDQMSAVLRIIANMQAIEDERKAKQRDRTARHRERNVTVTLPERDSNVAETLPKGTAAPPKENNQNPLTTDQKERGSAAACARSDFPKDAFESLFWPLYPRKASKGAARKVFERIQASGKVRFVDLMDGVRRLARSPPEMKFTPHAATWLNAEGWTDEPEDRAPSPAKRSDISAAIDRLDARINGRANHGAERFDDELPFDAGGGLPGFAGGYR